jgi:hypothetical protein
MQQLAGDIDATRLGITGHSQGACITATLSTDPHVQVVFPMAGSAAFANLTQNLPTVGDYHQAQ